MVWAFPASLAATKGIEFSFSSSSYLDVSVHWVGSYSPMDSVSCIKGCPIRKPLDQCLLPTPQSISLVTASFFASVCLGIHREPFVAWPSFYRKSLAPLLLTLSATARFLTTHVAFPLPNYFKNQWLGLFEFQMSSSDFELPLLSFSFLCSCQGSY